MQKSWKCCVLYHIFIGKSEKSTPNRKRERYEKYCDSFFLSRSVRLPLPLSGCYRLPFTKFGKNACRTTDSPHERRTCGDKPCFQTRQKLKRVALTHLRPFPEPGRVADFRTFAISFVAFRAWTWTSSVSILRSFSSSCDCCISFSLSRRLALESSSDWVLSEAARSPPRPRRGPRGQRPSAESLPH